MARKKQEEEEMIETQAEETGEATDENVSVSEEAGIETAAAGSSEAGAEDPSEATEKAAPKKEAAAPGEEKPVRKGDRGNRAQKVGTVKSDKMQKTCVVRVDRLVKHPIYRRYVRRRSSFMAHNEMGATTGDRVRIVETRPLSAHKRWRVVEIIQKAEK